MPFQSFAIGESASFTAAWEEETEFSFAGVELAWHLHLGGKLIISILRFAF